MDDKAKKQDEDHAILLAPDDDTKTGVAKSVDMLKILMETNADSETLRTSIMSLEEERGMKTNTMGEIPIQVYGLSQSIGVAMHFIMERRQNMQNVFASESSHLRSYNAVESDNEESDRNASSHDEDDSENEDSDENERESVLSKANGLKPKSVERRPGRVQCGVCGKTYNGRQTLRRHILVHLENGDPRKKKLQCEICGKQFSWVQTVREHKLREHKIRLLPDDDPRKKGFECDTCGKSFKWFQRQALRVHKKDHLAENDPRKKKFECETCGKLLRTSESLKRHMNTHLDYTIPEQRAIKCPFECEICGKRFAMKSHCQQHIEAVHPEIAQEDNETNNEGALEITKKTGGKFKCDVCDKSYKWEGSLWAHKRSHIDNDELKKPLQCAECGKRFVHNNQLQNHTIAFHLPDTDPRKKMLTCDSCGKAFASITELAKHMGTHLDENDPVQAELKRPFKCEECGCRFRNAANLRNHTKNIHNRGITVKAFVCDVCDRAYGKESALRAHKKKHLAFDDPRKAKYECEECGKIYFERGELKIHKTTHLDESLKRPFKCEKCKKAFRNAYNLKNHMNIHTGNFPFKCDICTNGFNSRGTLKAHMKGHKLGKSVKKNTMMCALCPKTFFSDKSMAKHVQQFHERKIKCDLCDMRFEQEYHMMIHKTKIHGVSSSTKKRKSAVGSLMKNNSNCDEEKDANRDDNGEGNTD